MNDKTSGIALPDESTVLREAETGLVTPQGEVAITPDMAPAEQKERLFALCEQIDFSDSQSILSFGVSAQREVTRVSEEMLNGVRNKDTGPAGKALNEMMISIRGLDTKELKEGKKPGFFARLLGRISPLAKFLQQYESVEKQIDRIERDLETHRHTLLKDVTLLDKLYDSTLSYFRDLELHIAAGKMRLSQANEEEIPAAKQTAEKSDDPLDAQRLRDLQTIRDDLERKIHDLLLTRQVIMQSLPSIRMTQELDKGLVSKIQSTILNTIPLWKNQLAQAVTIFRTQEAAGALKASTDLTDDLLKANAENLAQANRDVRKEMERGIFSIESVEEANHKLIAAIDESIAIAEEGRQRRAEAENRLVQCETELKQTLRKVG